MRSGLHGVACCLLLAAPGSNVALAQQPATAPAAEDAGVRSFVIDNKPWKGDFDAMLERRVIRVIVPYSRTLYFNDKGQERGIAAETVRDFERYVNQKYRKDKRPVTVVILPATRDRLLRDVASGLADIAAGNITVTESRRRQVDFATSASMSALNEVVVTGPRAPPVATLDDLSGKTVHTRPSSSAYESLLALNKRFAAAKKPPAKIVRLPDALEPEDTLEMANAGLLDIVVVDDVVADIWAQVLPGIKVHDDLKLRADARVGWAVRKGSPQLEAAILDFHQNFLVKQGVSKYRYAQYLKRARQIQDPTASAEWQRFEATLALFREYGAKYRFDPLMLAAQGYQESRLDQQARSQVGAVGVMQLMPATGAELKVGDIHQIEPNVHAGAKYLDQLMTRYFKDAHFDEANRALFAFAAYNAGPGRIQQMRTEAKKRGLDPDKWFNSVEIVVAEKVGAETTTYVRNIFKYYVAYKLIEDAEAAKRKARGQPDKPAR
jgi:membrane-bound lytic murein transglycosylase MltF